MGEYMGKWWFLHVFTRKHDVQVDVNEDFKQQSWDLDGFSRQTNRFRGDLMVAMLASTHPKWNNDE